MNQTENGVWSKQRANPYDELRFKSYIKRKSATSFGTPSKFYWLWASVCVCGALFSSVNFLLTMLRSSTLRAVDSFIRFYDFHYLKFTSMMFNSGNCSYWREWWRGRHRVTRFEFLRDFFFLWPRQNFEAVKMCLFVFWFRSCGKSVAIGCIARAHRQPIPYLTTETKLNDNSPMLSFFIKFQHLRVHELCYRVVCFSTEVFFSFWKFVERYASHLAAIEKKGGRELDWIAGLQSVCV